MEKDKWICSEEKNIQIIIEFKNKEEEWNERMRGTKKKERKSKKKIIKQNAGRIKWSNIISVMRKSWKRKRNKHMKIKKK